MTVPNFSKRGTTDCDDGCLLNYLPSTYPAPIQTGSAQTPAQAVLNTAALPPAGETVYCNEVVIAVPVGTEAGDIFLSQAPVASANTGKWTVSSTLFKTGRDLGLLNDLQYATFTFDCRDQSDYLINYNLVFGISGAVSPVPSQCVVLVQENSGTTRDPSTYSCKRCSYTVTTSTPIFYLSNFVATASGSPTVPATEFASGADINLAWESNGTFFQIYQKGNPTPVYAGTQTSCTLRGGVKTDTTFFLVAMVSGNPGGDRPQTGYQPVYLFDALTVTVSNPVLTPSALNVSGHAGVGTLGVTGQAEFANAGVSGLLNVTGATDLANTNVKGSLGVGVPQPQSRLHVNSDNGIRLGLEKNGGGQLVITNNANDDSVYLAAVSKDGIGAAKQLYLGTPGGPNVADLPRLVLHAGTTAVHGSLGVGLGAKQPQNAVDVNGSVVIGSTFAGAQQAPNSGLKVEGKVILNNDLAVENGTVAVNRLQFLGPQEGPQGWTAQTKSEGLQLTNSSGLAAQFAPDLSCWFQGPVGSAFGFNSAGPINLYDPNTNVWLQLSSATPWNSRYATLVPTSIPSDLRLKSEVRLVSSALEKIRRLRGVTFRWNEDGLRHFTRDVETTVSAGPDATDEENQKVWQTERDKRRDQLAPTQVGILAQEVEAVLPEAVSTDEAGYKTVRYDNLIPLLIEAVKEQGAQIQALSSEVSALGKRLRDQPLVID